MKRLTWLVITGIVLPSLVLASCSSAPSPAPAPSNPPPAAATQIRVATDATSPPFESINEQTNQFEGFDIDVMNAIAEKENLDIEFVNVIYDPLLAGMALGKYDAAISSITITAELKKDMLFSDPYFEAGQVVIVRTDNTAITGKDTLSGDIGALKGTTGATETEKVKAATLKTYDDIDPLFQDLMNGQINAVVCDNPVALGYAGKYPDKIKIVGGVFTVQNYGIAIAKGNTELQAKINAGIKAIKSEGLIEQLTEKWLEK